MCLIVSGRKHVYRECLFLSNEEFVFAGFAAVSVSSRSGFRADVVDLVSAGVMLV